MKNVVTLIIMFVVLGIGFVMYHKGKRAQADEIITTQLWAIVPVRCQPGYITYTDKAIQIYCQATDGMPQLEKDDIGAEVYAAVNGWQQGSTDYQKHAIHIRFTDQDYSSTKK